MILADKIIILRKKNGWSQEELAEQIGVSRQAVSKWEGAQSIPDLDKILLLSQTFSVTTDYLLKDELEEEEYTEIEPAQLTPDTSVHYVSMEEARDFLSIKEQTAGKIAFATFLCILSPICLLLLGACSETGYLPISENAAGGIGIIVLLFMVAAAVAIFISCGIKTSPFEYLEKEIIETAYGVNGMVKERQKQYQSTYTRHMILGTCLCILAIVPLFGALIFTEEDIIMVMMVVLLLIIVGIAVILFLLAGIPWGSMQQLLQEGDYTPEKKKQNSFIGPITVIYWLVATALYLGISFYTDDWKSSVFIWPVAGVLYAALITVCRLVKRP
ncbi:MAG: helix-turn-helix domain-containing protein [Lachnospiraceae bacterium]|jgi:transcriptional regulator with XRE-family HTH domain